MAVLFTFSAAGAFVQLGLGYLEGRFKLLAYGGELLLVDKADTYPIQPHQCQAGYDIACKPCRAFTLLPIL